MDSEKVQTLEDLCNYIEESLDTIFIRENIGNGWKSYSLEELPIKIAIKHIFGFIKNGMIPTRLKKEVK